MAVEISIDTRALTGLGEVPRFVSQYVRTRMRSLGQALRNELRATIARRSGKAQRAVRMRLGRGDDLSLSLFGALKVAPHLKTLEQGATLKPKQAQMLAIPVGRAANRHGQALFRARDLRDNPNAFGYQSSFVRGDVVFGVRRATIHPLFVLRKSLVFPRRSYFKNFARGQQDRIRQDLARAVAEAVAEFRARFSVAA
jgi:hypothetical protein